MKEQIAYTFQIGDKEIPLTEREINSIKKQINAYDKSKIPPKKDLKLSNFFG